MPHHVLRKACADSRLVSEAFCKLRDLAAQSQPVPLDAEPDFQAVFYWTRAVASGHLRDLKATLAALESFDRMLDEVRKTSYAYVADSMTGERDEVHARLAFTHGQMETAVKLITDVADKQDREGKGEVDSPAREMLADMLQPGLPRHLHNIDLAFALIPVG